MRIPFTVSSSDPCFFQRIWFYEPIITKSWRIITIFEQDTKCKFLFKIDMPEMIIFNISMIFSLILIWSANDEGGMGTERNQLFVLWWVQSGGNLSFWCGKRAKREEQNLSFSKHPKKLKTVEYWKSYKRFSVGLSDSKKSRYIYHACIMYHEY